MNQENFEIEVLSTINKGWQVGKAYVNLNEIQLQYKILTKNGADFTVPASTPDPKGGFEPAFSVQKETDVQIRKEILRKWKTRVADPDFIAG